MNRDIEIIDLIKAQDEKGLRLLYTSYSPALFGLAKKQLGNEEDAEEALQNTFQKIWNKIDQFDSSKSSFFTWMYNIMRNTAIDISRTKKFQVAQKTVSFDTNVHSDTMTYNFDFKMDSKNLLNGLDEKYVEVLDYLYLRGYSQSELSEHLDIPLGTIKTRVKKALDILREKLQGESKLFLGMLLAVIILVLLINSPFN